MITAASRIRGSTTNMTATNRFIYFGCLLVRDPVGARVCVRAPDGRYSAFRQNRELHFSWRSQPSESIHFERLNPIVCYVTKPDEKVLKTFGFLRNSPLPVRRLLSRRFLKNRSLQRHPSSDHLCTGQQLCVARGSRPQGDWDESAVFHRSAAGSHSEQARWHRSGVERHRGKWGTDRVGL